MHLDGCLVFAKSGPWKQSQAQIDGGRVQGIETLIQIDADRIVGIKRPGDSNQDMSEVGKDAAVARLVGVSQCSARHLAAKAEMVELPSY
jgi:hypothetical protein